MDPKLGTKRGRDFYSGPCLHSQPEERTAVVTITEVIPLPRVCGYFHCPRHRAGCRAEWGPGSSWEGSNAKRVKIDIYLKSSMAWLVLQWHTSSCMALKWVRKRGKETEGGESEKAQLSGRIWEGISEEQLLLTRADSGIWAWCHQKELFQEKAQDEIPQGLWKWGRG